MRIGELASASGCHLETVRYYERVGLIPPPRRSASGYRDYRREDVERLRFIVRSRALGFSLEEVRSLLALAGSEDASCLAVDALAREHLRQVQAKQRELAALAAELQAMIESCRRDTRATCSILQALADPGEAGSAH